MGLDYLFWHVILLCDGMLCYGVFDCVMFYGGFLTMNVQ